jgi:hypothetical protein
MVFKLLLLATLFILCQCESYYKVEFDNARSTEFPSAQVLFSSPLIISGNIKSLDFNNIGQPKNFNQTLLHNAVNAYNNIKPTRTVKRDTCSAPESYSVTSSSVVATNTLVQCIIFGADNIGITASQCSGYSLVIGGSIEGISVNLGYSTSYCTGTSNGCTYDDSYNYIQLNQNTIYHEISSQCDTETQCYDDEGNYYYEEYNYNVDFEIWQPITSWYSCVKSNSMPEGCVDNEG